MDFFIAVVLSLAALPAFGQPLAVWVGFAMAAPAAPAEAPLGAVLQGSTGLHSGSTVAPQWLHNGNPWKSIDFFVFFWIFGVFSEFLAKYSGFWSK